LWSYASYYSRLGKVGDKRVGEKAQEELKIQDGRQESISEVQLERVRKGIDVDLGLRHEISLTRQAQRDLTSPKLRSS